MKRPGSLGFTLIELMVAATLALLVLTLVVQLFIPALRSWSDSQRRSEVSQNLLVTTSWLGEDVVRCSPGSLKLTPEGALVMRCAMGQTVDHNNPFSQLVAYWLEAGEVFRASTMLSDPEAEPPVTLAELKGLPEQRRVANQVTAFELTIPQPWRLEVRLALDKEGRRGEIRTSYSSIYAPFDIELAEANEERQPETAP
jgi:hypothetical protein